MHALTVAPFAGRTPLALPAAPVVRATSAAAAARLVAGRVGGPPSARCACCAVELVELVAPMRLTVLDEATAALELVVTHAHSAAGGVACSVPTPVRCARPRCTLVARLDGAWCWLCDPR